MVFETHPNAAEGLTASEPVVSGHGRAMLVVVLFIADICTSAFAAVSNFMQYSLLSEVAEGGITPDQAASNDLRQWVVTVVSITVFVALVFAFLTCLHRVMKNLPALGNPKSRIEYTPAWAVGSFFIPFGHLFMPYRAVREAWGKSNRVVRSGTGLAFAPLSPSGLLVGWWVSWIAFGVVSRVASRLNSSSDDAETFLRATGVMIVANVVGILAAVLAILVVRGLDRRQEERSRNVTYAAHTPPPPLMPRPPQV